MDFNKLLQEVINEAEKLEIPISNNIYPIVKINTRVRGKSKKYITGA